MFEILSFVCFCSPEVELAATMQEPTVPAQADDGADVIVEEEVELIGDDDDDDEYETEEEVVEGAKLTWAEQVELSPNETALWRNNANIKWNKTETWYIFLPVYSINNIR